MCLTYKKIIGAVHGDPESVLDVLQYYSRYMDALATTTHYDVEARCHMESRLLGALSKFRV